MAYTLVVLGRDGGLAGVGRGEQAGPAGNYPGEAHRAVSLLRSEGLVNTVRGHGSYVRELTERRRVELMPGGSVIARMPSGKERRSMQLDEGVPVLEVRDPAGGVEVLAADEVELTRPA